MSMSGLPSAPFVPSHRPSARISPEAAAASARFEKRQLKQKEKKKKNQAHQQNGMDTDKKSLKRKRDHGENDDNEGTASAGALGGHAQSASHKKNKKAHHGGSQSSSSSSSRGGGDDLDSMDVAAASGDDSDHKSAGHGSTVAASDAGEGTAASTEKKKKKKKKNADPERFQKLKERQKAEKTSSRVASGMNESVELIASRTEQAEFFNKRYKERWGPLGSVLSEMEQYEQLLGNENIISVKDQANVAAHAVEQLAGHVKALLTSLHVKNDDWQGSGASGDGESGPSVVAMGSPRVLIMTNNALRAVELIRSMRSLGLKTQIVKLFARHLSVDEQQKLLEGDVRVVVGTPSRVLKLAESGNLKLDKVRLVVLDMAPDGKRYTMLTYPDIALEFFRFYQRYLWKQIKVNKARIFFF